MNAGQNNDHSHITFLLEHLKRADFSFGLFTACSILFHTFVENNFYFLPTLAMHLLCSLFSANTKN